MILSIKHITKSYGQKKALENFTAELSPGIYALLGPNGSGKSTLSNIITDNLKADSGNITYDGEDTLKMGVKFREKLGYMPQYSNIYPNFSIERFMWYMAALKGLDKKTAEEQIKQILQAVELYDVFRKKIGSLSGGMKQRLTLAQAVLGDPKILILDEPTSGLDPKQRIAIRNFISKISFEKIVLISTHVVSDIEFISKEVIILKEGVIIDIKTPFELTKKISNKVWNIVTNEESIPKMQEKYRVINILKGNNGVNLRVLSENKPDEIDVLNSRPTLEDYYLYVFGNNVDHINT